MADLDYDSETFKMSRNPSKEVLEQISLQSSQYQLDILPKIFDNLKNCLISRKRMRFSAAWLINNLSAEQIFNKRKEKLSKNMPVSIGFLYASTLKQLNQIAQCGTIKSNNIKVSQLATASMGVSVCQYADIFHPGFSNIRIPHKGYLVLVKYLKGKVNYVSCDSSPMDPQPQFDCHMVKSPTINRNTSCLSSFHQTQVFIYDYNDDGEIVTCQSKILPFAAVEFEWIGPYIFKMREPACCAPMICEDYVEDISIANDIIEQNKRHISTFAIHNLNTSSTIPFQLSITSLSNIEMNSMAYVYFLNPVISFLRSDHPWQMSGAIENIEFEREFRGLKIFWNNKRCPKSSKDLNLMSQDILISPTSTNVLSSAGVEYDFGSFDDLSNIPQFVTYIRIVIDSYQYSRRLCDLFNISKTMGFISRPYETNMPIFIFPDGEISKKLGIPSIPDVYYFHGLVFHSQFPQFTISCNTAESQKEKNIYFSCLSALQIQSIPIHFNSSEHLIRYEVLMQTLISQIRVQKAFLLNIVRPKSNNSTISYNSICFESPCEDFNCFYHYPLKVMKLNESGPQGNIVNVNCSGYSQTDVDTHKHRVSNDYSDLSNPQCFIPDNESEKGSFFSLKFLTYCKAGYSDLTGFKVKVFSSTKSNDFYSTHKRFSKQMWSFNQDHFKQYGNWLGTSSYQ